MTCQLLAPVCGVPPMHPFTRECYNGVAIYMMLHHSVAGVALKIRVPQQCSASMGSTRGGNLQSLHR